MKSIYDLLDDFDDGFKAVSPLAYVVMHCAK